MSTKTEIRKQVGRGKFTTKAFAEAREVSVATARKQVRDLLSEGALEVAGTEKVTDAEGNPQRGRPRFQYRVTQGK